MAGVFSFLSISLTLTYTTPQWTTRMTWRKIEEDARERGWGIVRTVVSVEEKDELSCSARGVSLRKKQNTVHP